MRVVCISDTHMAHEEIEVPAGDILIHAGDATGRGTLKEVAGFCNWFASQPHKHKIFVAGNHDILFEQDPALARSLVNGFHYLQDYEVIINGLHIWGSPWTPEFNNWAFNLPRGESLRARWQRIPQVIDILVTHGPPAGILDMTVDGRSVGDEDLLRRVNPMAPEVVPSLHVFGHVHSAYGRQDLAETTFVNASICNEEYEPVNKPVVVEI